jgi:uncharacterized protein
MKRLAQIQWPTLFLWLTETLKESQLVNDSSLVTENHMLVTLYDASVPVFIRYLERLARFVDSAEGFTKVHGPSIEELLTAKLAPTMLCFERQVFVATSFTLRSAFPLAGESIPPYGEFPETLEGLRARLGRTVALLRTLRPSQFVGAEERTLESQAGDVLVRLKAPEFVFQYALPNFVFHVTAAYAILRSQGVPLGKEDFDGFHSYPRMI